MTFWVIWSWRTNIRHDEIASVIFSWVLCYSILEDLNFWILLSSGQRSPMCHDFLHRIIYMTKPLFEWFVPVWFTLKLDLSKRLIWVLSFYLSALVCSTANEGYFFSLPLYTNIFLVKCWHSYQPLRVPKPEVMPDKRRVNCEHPQESDTCFPL